MERKLKVRAKRDEGRSSDLTAILFMVVMPPVVSMLGVALLSVVWEATFRPQEATSASSWDLVTVGWATATLVTAVNALRSSKNAALWWFAAVACGGVLVAVYAQRTHAVARFVHWFVG